MSEEFCCRYFFLKSTKERTFYSFGNKLLKSVTDERKAKILMNPFLFLLI